MELTRRREGENRPERIEFSPHFFVCGLGATSIRGEESEEERNLLPSLALVLSLLFVLQLRVQPFVRSCFRAFPSLSGSLSLLQTFVTGKDSSRRLLPSSSFSFSSSLFPFREPSHLCGRTHCRPTSEHWGKGPSLRSARPHLRPSPPTRAAFLLGRVASLLLLLSPGPEGPG